MIKVLGLGDNVVDKYMHIKTMYPGGNALNIAVLARLSGIEVGYLGVFGDDEAAKHVYKTVSDMGIDVSHCRFYHGENGYAEVRLDDGDRVFIGSNQGGVSKEHPIDSFTDIELDYIAEYDVCHTSIFSYVEESLPEIPKASGFVSFDFSNRYDEEYLKKVCPYIDMAAISCGDMPKEEIIEEDTMPGMEILRMYKELGGRIITAGSDSHRPERIGYGFDRVYQMLKEAGFDSISIYKNRKNIQQPI